MTPMFQCEDAAEYVSALADGETIPSAFAQHIGSCAACQARLHDYLAMGVELRLVASVDADDTLPALSIDRRRTSRSLWKKGLETMRIPKFAFALLIVAVVVLASSLTIVKVGAHSSGSVLMLNVTAPGDTHFKCAIDTRLTPGQCIVIGSVERTMSGFQFTVLARDDDRVQLGVRTKVAMAPSTGTSSMGSADVKDQPQTRYWFEPGQTLKIDVDSLGSLTVAGKWMDHVPTMVNENQLDPNENELRIVSPLLLRDKQVVGDMEGGTAVAPGNSNVAMIYLPGTGRFLLSNTPMQHATQANVKLNRISFDVNGAHYLFLMGAPVTRSDKIWVLYQPDFIPRSGGEGGFIGSGELRQIAPEAVLPANH